MVKRKKRKIYNSSRTIRLSQALKIYKHVIRSRKNQISAFDLKLLEAACIVNCELNCKLILNCKVFCLDQDYISDCYGGSVPMIKEESVNKAYNILKLSKQKLVHLTLDTP